EYNRATARLDAGLLFLAAIALVSPSAIAKADLVPGTALTQKLSLALAVLLIVGYGLGLLFSLKTHREIFASAEHAEPSEPAWPVGLALATLAVVTVLVALVSEIFVESVQKAAETFGMSQAFVGFIVVALVGAAAEMAAGGRETLRHCFPGSHCVRTGTPKAWGLRPASSSLCARRETLRH